MEAPPVFLKFRAVAFFCITCISLLWIILLSVVLFLRWDVSDVPERSFMVLLISINVITVIMLPVLILCDFRPYLDGARLLFLLTAHIGAAGAFTYWNPKFQCAEQTPDQVGVCRLINIYTLLASWVDPALLLTYAACLACMVYLRSRLPISAASSKASDRVDEENEIGRQSHLPMMLPEIGWRSRSGSSILWHTDTITTPAERGRAGSHQTLSESRRKSTPGLEKTQRNPARLVAGRSLPPWY